jgi:ATP-dependent DNA helicase RecQ
MTQGTYSQLLQTLDFSSDESPKEVHDPYSRLASAINSTVKASPRELAILIRQTLFKRRAETLSEAHLRIPVGSSWPGLEDYEACSLTTLITQKNASVSAEPWIPEWLPNAQSGVGTTAHLEAPRRPKSSPESSSLVDPLLNDLGLHTYRSHGQKQAVRAALRTPPGGTLAICLPTGEGKSTVFHGISKSRFYQQVGTKSGTTIVVVPTVALALDHERKVAQDHGLEHRTAFIGGLSDTEASGIFTRIEEGSQGLIFSSPEALVGRLRLPILNAAKAGLIKALVVDEAHMIDAWGSSFRPEFQMLSGLRRQIISEQPLEMALRTILLSATFTEESLELMASMFSDGVDQFDVCSASALRPEIEYWIAAPTTKGQREQRIYEALMHAPRPAILYTTRVDDADYWYGKLKTEGFTRVRSMTGDTDDTTRRDIGNDWINGSVDLVIATSAFGLGVDNPNVRSIIHACIPESVDRYYQEVGRGGRDGNASMSLVLPAHGDENVAGGISDPRLVTAQRAFGRWRSMWGSEMRSNVGQNVFRIPVDVPPGITGERMDMGGPMNTLWHHRTLNTMAAAGLIELLGSDFEIVSSGDEPDSENSVIPETLIRENFQTVRIVDTEHLREDHFVARFDAYRNAQKASTRNSLNVMTRISSEERCVASLLTPVYSVQNHNLFPDVQVQDACGGCPHCRANQLPIRAHTGVPSEHPWKTASDAAIPPSFEQPLLVRYSSEELIIQSTKRRLTSVIGSLIRGGVANVLFDPSFPVGVKDIWDQTDSSPMFVEYTSIPDVFPDGPVLVLAGTDIDYATQFLGLQSSRQNVLGIFDHRSPDPRVPSTSFVSRYGGRTIGLNQFLSEVLI